MIVGGGAWVVFHQPFVYPFALGFEILNTKAYVGVELFMTSTIFMNEKVKSTAAADFLTLWHCTHTSQRTWCTSLSRETQIILLKFFGCTNSKTLKAAAAVLRESRLNSWHFTRQEKRVNYLLLMLHFSFLQQRWRSQNQNFVPSKKRFELCGLMQCSILCNMVSRKQRRQRTKNCYSFLRSRLFSSYWLGTKNALSVFHLRLEAMLWERKWVSSSQIGIFDY